MSIVKVSYYRIFTSEGHLADGSAYETEWSKDSSFTLPYVNNNYPKEGALGYLYFGKYSICSYPYNGGTTASKGTAFYAMASTNDVNGRVQWSPYHFTMGGQSKIVDEGTRTVSVRCSAGGSIAHPAVAAGDSIIVHTGAVGDRSAKPDVISLTVGSGAPATGTLIKRGDTEGVFSHWTCTLGVISLGGNISATTISASLIEGSQDGVIVANFTTTQNPPNVWSPDNQNIVVHLLDNNLSETANSVNFVKSYFTWRDFRKMAFSAFECSSGSSTRDWTSSYTSNAYLLNVTNATFAVTPITGKRVYGWKLKLADGTVVDYGVDNTATMTDFEEGCEVHLYITSATPNPVLIYDGFDTSGVVPANEDILVGGPPLPVGSFWSATAANTPVTVLMSPVVWSLKGIGQRRSVLLDGVETSLPNVAGTATTVISDATPFALNHVKFKQIALPTDGTLTATIVIDAEPAIAANMSVSLAVSQLNTVLDTITASKEVGYYQGDEPLQLSATVDYGGEAPSGFTLRIKPDEAYDDDELGIEQATLQATGLTRAVTVSLTQIVPIGNLVAVQVNITRTVGIGTMIPGATSAGPTTQSYAGGISVTMPAEHNSAAPIYVECVPKSGYTLKSIHVQSEDGLSEFYTGPAPQTSTAISLGIPREHAGVNIKVILVTAAVIVSTPRIEAMVPDDLGKFTATIAHGESDFRVGDEVTLNVSPVEVDEASIIGLAIGAPTFNDTSIIPVRTGVSVAVTVTLGITGNVFKVPVYAEFEPSTSPAGASAAIISTEWNVDDTLVIDGVTYYRIGATYTVTVPLTSGSPTYTVISAQIKQRVIAAGTANYIETGVLLPEGEDAISRTFTGIMRGETQVVVVYGIGNLHPIMVFAAFDYDANNYITQGERPSITTTPVSSATLSDNQIESISWPASTPGVNYEDAAFLVREVTSDDRLPKVDVRVSSSIRSGLEVWNPTSSVWVPYLVSRVTLIDEYTFFRATVGDAPADLVTVAFEEAEDADGTTVPGGVVYATSGVVYDGTFVLPASMQARARSVLHVRATPPTGYVVTGWYVDGELRNSGVSLSTIVLDTGLTLKPVVELRSVLPTTVMVLDGDPNNTDEGRWVSKVFRAQAPWKPLTAHVIAHPDGNPITLGVLKTAETAPEELDVDDPGTVIITTAGDNMRRLPPGQIQKTRFVRYMVVANGEVEVVSVAIGSGALTMKRGH